ncbi:RHS repeat-associated protein [Pseudomonas sp. Y3 TE3536]
MRSTGHELFFYKAGKPASVLGEQQATTYLRVDTTLLSDLTGGSAASLLAVESSGSVLQDGQLDNAQGFKYTPYGLRSAGDSRVTRVGFNGEYLMPSLSAYMLGNGYRAFNPVLMRFHSPDSFSPFRIVNAYAYCGGDPINNSDPDGHMLKKHLLKYKANIKVVKNNTRAFDVAFKSVADLPTNMLLSDAEAVIKQAHNRIQKIHAQAEQSVAWILKKTEPPNPKYSDKVNQMVEVLSGFEDRYTSVLKQMNDLVIQRYDVWAASAANQVVKRKIHELTVDRITLMRGGEETSRGGRTLAMIENELIRLEKQKVNPGS